MCYSCQVVKNVKSEVFSYVRAGVRLLGRMARIIEQEARISKGKFACMIMIASDFNLIIPKSRKPRWDY